MSVQYKANSVNVSDNINENLMIYAHPGDIVSFDFDVSALEKEIVNGDLVIHLLNGKSVTVVNFGLMVLDNKSPRIEDNNRSYDPFSLFGGEAYYEQDVGRYVISRVVSSPDKLSAADGTELPSSKDRADGEGVFSKQVGNFLTTEQSLVPEFAPLLQDFVTRTLQQEYTKLYESDINFTAKNHFSYNEVNSNIFPIRLLIINPKVTPEYGTEYRSKTSEIPEHKDYKDLFIDIGGGKLKGDDFASLMYSPTTIDLSNEHDKYWFDGPSQNNKIIRYFHVGVPTETIVFSQVIVSGLPSGVVIPNKLDSNLIVKPLGSGAFEITVSGLAGGVDIPMEYPIGFGGQDGVFASLGISYEAVQSKSGDLVRGNNIVYFEFKPVRGPEDISNFNKFNTYTYSTLRDPLIIRFGSGNDVIKGGEGNYIYYGTAGDNRAYGGSATEVFHLGIGNNKFYAGMGNDTVDVENLSADNGLYLSDAIESADQNSTRTIVDNGEVIFTGKHNGVNFKSVIKNFSNVYFDIGDKDIVTDRNDVVTINSTWGMALNTTLHMGNGNNTVRAGSNSILVDFKTFNGLSKAVFITTHNTSRGVFVQWGNGDNRVIGSESNDTIVGYNDNESVSFDGNGGINTADYSNVTVNLTYDVSSGTVYKEGQSSLDRVVDIQKFIGGTLENTFYGSVYYTTFNGSKKQSNIEFFNNGFSDKSKLSYSRLKSVSADDKKENGVIIDLSNNTVKKVKTGGIDRFNNINLIEASNNNDTFIVSSDVKSSSLNGLGGFNVVDYSKSVVQVDFSISEACSGTVTKGNGTHGVDTISNFRHFIGSSLGSTFSLNDFKFNDRASPYRFIVEGRSDFFSNRVNYSTVTGKAIVIDMKLNEPFIATLYSGKTTNSPVIGTDLLIKVGVLGLTNEADNVIYMYSQEQLGYVLDSGVNGNSLISFENANQPVNINFYGTNFSNINGVSILRLSKGNDKITMGAGFFGQEIDGYEGNNEIDFSNLSSPIITEINLEGIELAAVNIGSKNIKVKNFSSIVATASDDIFNIKFDLVNINRIKDKNISFDGSQGINVISFVNVKNSVNSSAGLIIDISEGIVSKVTDSLNNFVLRFVDFNRIIGSQGNDVFILPVSAFDFTIDGGGGSVNTVSYQAYTQGIHISEGILSRFKNIQKVIGSQGNDIISLDGSTSLYVDGFTGFNAAHYYGTIDNAVNVEVSDALLTVVKGDKSDVLSHIGFLDFSSAVVPNGITFNINTLNNNVLTGGSIFLCGSVDENNISKDKIDYSRLSVGLTLNLDIQTNGSARGFWFNVDKGNDNKDYIQNVGRVILSKNSTVKVYDSIGALTNISSIVIDGNESGVLTFSQYNGTVFIDVSVFTMRFGRVLEVTFLGFNSFEGASGNIFDTTFLSSGDKSYTFNGLSSKSKLSYERLESDLNVVVKGTNSKGYNELDVAKPNNSDTAYNIMRLRGSKGNTNIVFEQEVYNDMFFDAEAGSKSKISYENINNSGVMIFAINNAGVHVTRSNGLYNDKVANFSDIVGSKGNSRFEIDTRSLQSSTVLYNVNGGGGVNTVNFTNSSGLDIAFIMNSSGIINVNFGSHNFGTIYNMNYIFSTSSSSNTFVLGNFFNRTNFEGNPVRLAIYGSSNKNSTDVLDLKDTNLSLSLDPLLGRISLSNNDSIYILASVGIHTINLGNGDHQVDISSGMSAVGWQVINGGSGNNNISFSKLLSGITYDLSSGIKDLGFVLVNFTGVTGSRGNDTFILRAVNENIKGMRVDGFGSSLNTLDYSDLNVAIKIDIDAQFVLRGGIRDIVSNIQIFKTGRGGAEIKVNKDGKYQFFGNERAIDLNLLSYEGTNQDIIFNFMTKSIVKSGSNYDSFSGISKFIGGSGNNTFLFSTEGLNQYVTAVELNGSNGKYNVVNLSRLSAGITYEIASKFFTVAFNNKTLRVNLENINQVIGTSLSDTFIFSDEVNNFNANGGVSEQQVRNTADLSSISSSVTVDFYNRSIVFGNNRNSFSNIEKFIGSRAGGNVFKGLSSSSHYEIDGGTAEAINGGNTIEYSGGAISGLILSVKNGSLHISKSGDIIDVFKNIHNLKLSALSDELHFNSTSDLNVYKMFQIIDGGLGDNLVTFNTSLVNNSITVDIDAGYINIGGNSANIKIVGFNSWKFANGTGHHTIVAGEGGFDFRLVEFGVSNNSTLDLVKVYENLVVSILDDGVTSIVTGNSSGSRGTLINLKNLLLGNGVYSLSFVKFNPSLIKILNVIAGNNATSNLIVDQYVGVNSKIEILGRSVRLDSASFTSVSSISIGQATQNVSIEFNSQLVVNGVFNFYLNNANKARSTVVFTLATSVSGTDTDTVSINSNNNIILKSQDNSKVFVANFLTNSGIFNINYDVVNLNISSFNTNFKSLSVMSSTVNLDFSNLSFSSEGIFYNLVLTNNVTERELVIKEGTEGNGSYNVKFNNTNIPSISVIGSYNSDTFNFRFSDARTDLKVNITENGSASNINVLNLSFTSPGGGYNITLNNSSLLVGQLTFNLLGEQKVNIFNFNSTGSNIFATTDITVTSTLRLVTLPQLSTRTSTSYDKITIPASETGTGGVQAVLNFADNNTASGFMHYGTGNKFDFKNFFVNPAAVASIFSIQIEDTVNTRREDTFTIRGNRLAKGSKLFINYTDANNTTVNLQALNNVMNFSNWNTFDNGFTLELASVFLSKLHVINFSNGTNISFTGTTKVLLNVTNATNNNPAGKHVISISNIEQLVSNHYFSFGNLNSMKLPVKYRILVERSGGDFPANNMYPEWIHGRGNGKNNLKNYDTYNNVFSYSSLQEGVSISVNLNVNSNNESVFRTSANSYKTTISGANLFWIGQSNLESINVKVHELSRAKPFALMLNDNSRNVIDFSSVKDNQDYLFRFIYQSVARNDKQVGTITNLPTVPGTVPLDNTMTVYGSFAGAKNLILTSSKNTMYVHGEFSRNMFERIDGGSGLSTISFAANYSQSRTIDFTAGQNKGFKVWNYSTQQPVDILFTNIKIIENSYRPEFYGIEVIFNTASKFDKNFESSFIVRQPQKLNGEFVSDLSDITFTDRSSSTNIFLNNKFALFSNDSTDSGTFTIAAEDFAITKAKLNSAVLFIGLKLDFSHLASKDHSLSQTITWTVNYSNTLFIPKTLSQANYIINMPNGNELHILEHGSSGKSIVIRSNQQFDVKTYDVTGFSTEEDQQTDEPTTLSYTDILYTHPSFLLTEGNNMYKTRPNVTDSSANKVAGSEVWSSKYEYESRLTRSVVDEQYWKDVDSRIKNAFLYEEDKNNKKEIISSTNLDEDSTVKNDYVVKKELFNQGSYEEDVSSNNNVESSIKETDATNTSAGISRDFDLNSILEAAKNVVDGADDNSNHSSVLDNFSIDLIPIESIESTFIQDEANSMSYTVDTVSSSMSSFHSTSDSNVDYSTIYEQQKKVNS